MKGDRLRRQMLTDVRAQKHLEKGTDEIIDPLNVTRSGMPYRPDIEDPLETLRCHDINNPRESYP